MSRRIVFFNRRRSHRPSYRSIYYLSDKYKDLTPLRIDAICFLYNIPYVQDQDIIRFDIDLAHDAISRFKQSTEVKDKLCSVTY